MQKRIEVQKIDHQLLWHPFTQRSSAFPPPVIVKARGIKLWDTEGHWYYDTISSWWTSVHGHGHPALVRAVSRQIKRLDHVNFSGFTHPLATELSRRLYLRLPQELSRFFYSDDGSTAVEAAIKLAFQYHANTGNPQKTQFAHFENSYHGDTLGAVGVSGLDDFHAPFEKLKFSSYRLKAPVRPVPTTSCTLNPVGNPCPEDVWRDSETRLRAEADRTAAVIVEPLIQCVAGMLPYPAEYLKRLEKLCKELNILVIYDEVATGFGRTGTFFALDQAGTVPDFLCLAKGLSGGVLPLALTVTTPQISSAFEGFPVRTFFHGHSYTANPIACAAALASLDIFERKKVMEKAAPVRKLFHEILASWCGHAGLGDVRFLGHIGAVDLISPLTRTSWDARLKAGQRVYRKSLEKGLVLRPLGDTIYWFLPLSVREKDLGIIMQRSLDVITGVMEELSKEGPLDGNNTPSGSPRDV
ncbi:MAG: adenosylmethionine--8-amino-7-oxononanoate transaminase [Spirochaetales bacterium]|nr:adenosylmethionine--8-amino-7-oxononanoate transaminase [Spirochaetales bacterium]